MRAPGPIAVFGLGAALALGGALLVWLGAPAGPPTPRAGGSLSATVTDDVKPLPDFSLARAGGSFANADLMGRWSLFFFGYTFCPDACPTAMALLREVKTAAASRGLAAPQVVMVSVDPARDTPQVLARYVAAFDRAFIGAVGSDADIAPLAKHLGVMYARHDQGGSRDYTVDHSVGIYLIDPKGRLKAVFTPPQDAARMAADYAALTR